MFWRGALLLLFGCGRVNFASPPASDAEADAPVAPPDGATADGALDSGSVEDSALVDSGADVRPADGGEADADAPAPNLVFVTSETFRPGELGSLANADAHCERLADGAGIGGTYRAWLSTSTVDARERLGTARGWNRMDGRPVVDTVADLTTGRMLHPIRFDETGTDVGVEYFDIEVVSGTDDDGTHDETCGDWTVTTGSVNYGWAHATMGAWAAAAYNSCGNMLRLYCFGIDRTVALEWTPDAGRTGFVSAAPFAAGGGLDSADALCQSEATAAGLSGTFLALLATEASSAASRFDAGELPWVRVDGIRIAATASDFMLGNLDASLNVTASGSYVDRNVWTGAASPMDAGAGLTCASWTSTAMAQNAHYGAAQLTGLPFFDRFDRACDLAFEHVYCLER